MTSLTSPRFSTVKAKLRGGCAAITCTLMLSLGAPAQAQTYIPPAQIPSGTTVTQTAITGGTRTDVTVTEAQTLINWQMNAPANGTGPAVFLGSNDRLDYQGTNSDTRYVVFNQFVSGTENEFNSAISILGEVTSGSNVDLWFQNSGGILIGENARFDVGSLVLTTSSLARTGVYTWEGESDIPDRRVVNIRSTAGSPPTAGIDVRGQITVGGSDRSDAYYAIIAPRINIAATSTATVAGSVAYVAAEAADITIREGLFDIQVSSGSSVQDALVHSGSTMVAASSDSQNIYMIAMPKNDAITMLVGGNLGWNATTSSVASDGSIILSAGRNISGRSVDTSSSGNAGGEIQFSTASGIRHFNGEIEASATNRISANVASGATLKIANDAYFTADQEVKFTVNGTLAMNQLLPPTGESSNYTGADLRLYAASAAGVGGNAEFLVDGGTLQLGGDLIIATDIYTNNYGEGESGEIADGGSQLSGGISQLTVTGNGSILGHADGTSNITIYADVYGYDLGQSQGGTARLTADNGSINLLADPAANPESPVTSDQGRITLYADGGKAGRVEVRAANNAVIQAATLDASAGGETSESSSSLTASDGIILVANNGRLNFTDSIYAQTSGNIGFHVTGPLNNAISAGRVIYADAGGHIELRHSGRAANANSLQASALAWSAGRTITADSDSKITINLPSGEDDYYGEGENGYYIPNNSFNAENIELGHLQTAWETWLQSEQGSVTVTNLSGDGGIWAEAQSITLSGTSDLNLYRMDARNGNLTVTTTGLLSMSGSVDASEDIILTSSGIAGLGGEGSISNIRAGGRLRLINANPANPMIIGGFEEYYGEGDPPPPAYRIDYYALGSYFASNDISFESPATSSNSAPQIIIRDADFNLYEGGKLSFISGGSIRVEGFLYAGTYDAPLDLNLTAANSIHIVANPYSGNGGEGGESGEGYYEPGGSIFVDNWANPEAATLNLSAPRIFASTQAAYDDLASAISLRQYELRLAQNDGINRGEFISAYTVNVETKDGFFVQNISESANTDDRSGIIFGQGGLNITSTNASPMLVLNGYQLVDTTSETPTYLYGSGALAGVTINGQPAASARGFNRQSMMNGCQLVNATICGPEAVPPPTETEFPIQVITDDGDPTKPVGTKDEEEEELLSEERESSEMPESLIRTNYLVPRTGQPLLIDPVTGAANDDMWGPATP
jgi:filamentous hemagglutinin family protein